VGILSSGKVGISDRFRHMVSLPVQHTQRTKIVKSIYEELACHWRYCNKIKTLYMGQKPSFIPKNKIVTKKEMRHYNHLNSYINPIVRAKEYLKLLKKKGLLRLNWLKDWEYPE